VLENDHQKIVMGEKHFVYEILHLRESGVRMFAEHTGLVCVREVQVSAQEWLMRVLLLVLFYLNP
jgi:hypothetical protein